MLTISQVAMVRKCYILTFFFNNLKQCENLVFVECTSFLSLREKGASL